MDTRRCSTCSIVLESSNNTTCLTTEELRQKWASLWGIQPHRYIRREMLEKSLLYKQRQLSGTGLTPEQQKKLDNLVAQYRRDPECFDDGRIVLSPGTRLVREWQNTKYSVLVLEAGFEYRSKAYTSLSEIAFAITGTRWNGWVFFGLKKRKKTS